MKKGNFTDEDIENAKNLIFATINNIEEEISKELLENTNIISKTEEKLFSLSKEKVSLKELLDTKNSELNSIKEKLELTKKEYESLKN